jgi:hypothetical protein
VELGNEKLWYRGVPDIAHPLVATIGRALPYSDCTLVIRPQQECELLHRFRRRSYLECGRLLSAGEALLVARHHGLPTRLLDWTANALYGLYFACCSEPTRAGRLWAISRYQYVTTLDSLALAQCQDEIALLALLCGPMSSGSGPEPDRPRLKLLEPLYNSPRIRAQDGAFTVQRDACTPMELYVGVQFNSADLDISCLYGWTITAASKSVLIRELSGMGITDRMVFPDLDGIARSLWQTEVLWRGNQANTDA